MAENAIKKQTWDRPTDRPTDRQTDIVTYRVALHATKKAPYTGVPLYFDRAESVCSAMARRTWRYPRYDERVIWDVSYRLWNDLNMNEHAP